MLGQQTVGRARALPVRGHTEGLGTRLALNPAIAGRQRLAAFMNESVLVQLVLAMALVFIALLLYLNQASQADVLQFNIQSLQQEYQQLSISQANLHVQANGLQSTSRIQYVATAQLHMSQPDLRSAIWIKTAIPTVSLPPPDTLNVTMAKHDSAPLTWMTNAVSWFGSQL